MQHIGDLVVTGYFEQHGQVTGTTIVKGGGELVCHGQLAGGLIIEEGGRAIVRGQVARNVINRGELHLYGQIAGRLIGRVTNKIHADQIVGTDLEVPFRGTTKSWTEQIVHNQGS